MSRIYEKDVQRSTIVMLNAMLKTIKHPAAAVLTKVADTIDGLLEKYPGKRYRLSVESIDDERRTDREAEEEQADPSENHYR